MISNMSTSLRYSPSESVRPARREAELPHNLSVSPGTAVRAEGSHRFVPILDSLRLHTTPGPPKTRWGAANLEAPLRHINWL